MKNLILNKQAAMYLSFAMFKLDKELKAMAKRCGVLATARYMKDLGYPLFMARWILAVKS